MIRISDLLSPRIRELLARRPPPQQIVDMGCPLSGGALVLRQGPHGDFLGCSDYPECEYVEEI